MKITYFLETGWPEGKKRPDPSIDGAEWQRAGEIPFVPVVGMMIDSGEGNLRKVEEVYWSADAPDSIQVQFEFDDYDLPYKRWTELGWEMIE